MRRNAEFDELPLGVYPWGEFTVGGYKTTPILTIISGEDEIYHSTLVSDIKSAEINNARILDVRNNGVNFVGINKFVDYANEAAYTDYEIGMAFDYNKRSKLGNFIVNFGKEYISIGEKVGSVKIDDGSGRLVKCFYGRIHSHPSIDITFSESDVNTLLKWIQDDKFLYPTNPASFVFDLVYLVQSNAIHMLMLNPNRRIIFRPMDQNYIFNIISRYLDRYKIGYTKGEQTPYGKYEGRIIDWQAPTGELIDDLAIMYNSIFPTILYYCGFLMFVIDPKQNIGKQIQNRITKALQAPGDEIIQKLYDSEG